jgi:NADH-quinone oxidoreductase subunit J
MAEVFFFLAAIGAVAGAIGTVSLRNPFYAVLALVCHLLALAALFLLLRAEFVAAAQVVVYAGAVMVLYVFVVAYVGGQDQPLGGGGGGALRVVSMLFAGALFAELCIAVLGSGLAALGTEGAGIRGARGEAADTGFGTAAEMGRLFLTRFLVAFEVASLLLLVAAVGAVILARRRSGLDDPRELSVGDVLRGDAGTRIEAPRGTMIEAGGPPER